MYLKVTVMVSLFTRPGEVKPTVGLVPPYVFDVEVILGVTVIDFALIEITWTTLLAGA